MARLLKTRDSGHKQAIESYIVEDLKVMSDFEIHKTCETYRVSHRLSCVPLFFFSFKIGFRGGKNSFQKKSIMFQFMFQCIEHLSLGNHLICDSGKFQLLDDLLPIMKDAGDRVLIFSQFTMLLDVMERYLKIRGHKFLR